MHIENANFHINLGGGPIAAAALAALLGRESADTEPASPGTLPLIGDSWPSVDGIFAGIARPEGTGNDGRLVLLNAQPPKAMSWAEMKVWAENLGDGARLPTRWEGALLYANLQGSFDTDKWYWLLDESQSSSGNAWGQYFDYGGQFTGGKSYEGWGCAVRIVQLA
jgi:hypothetical protein